MLALLALSRAIMDEWRLAKLTIINKLKINYLILLLSSTDGPLLRYMHEFRIMQNVQEKFVSGIMLLTVVSGIKMNRRRNMPGIVDRTHNVTFMCPGRLYHTCHGSSLYVRNVQTILVIGHVYVSGMVGLYSSDILSGCTTDMPLHGLAVIFVV